jgi:flagellar protein FlgJ
MLKVSGRGAFPDILGQRPLDRGDGHLRLKRACKEFESIFTYELLKSMRRTVEKCDLFHGEKGEDVYESLFDMELSKSMAGMGRNSLSGLLYRQLKGISETGDGEKG